MAFLNRRVRAAYAGAVGVLGFALGSVTDSLAGRSEEEQSAQAPIYLRSERSAPKVEIEGKSIEWWRARAGQNRRTINRLKVQARNSSSNRSS